MNIKIADDLLGMLYEVQTVKGDEISAIIDKALRPKVFSLYREYVGPVRVAENKPIHESGVDYGGANHVIKSSSDVFRLCVDMCDLKQEQMDILCLNTQNRVTRREMLYRGTSDMAVIHPRDVFRAAIKYSAASIILVHNHPGGDSEPSEDDIQTTRHLIKVGQLVDIPIIDHVIIGRLFYSMKRKGKI